MLGLTISAPSLVRVSNVAAWLCMISLLRPTTVTLLYTRLVLLRQRAARTTATFRVPRACIPLYSTRCRVTLMLVAGLLRIRTCGWRISVPVSKSCCPTLLDSRWAQSLVRVASLISVRTLLA